MFADPADPDRQILIRLILILWIREERAPQARSGYAIDPGLHPCTYTVWGPI